MSSINFSFGGFGGMQNLQQVTDIGNITTNALVSYNRSQFAKIYADASLAVAGVFPNGEGTNDTHLFLVADSVIDKAYFEYQNSLHIAQILFNQNNALTHNSAFNFRDIDGPHDIAFTDDFNAGVYNNGTFTGGVITINHGLPRTPKYAGITAGGANSAAVLAPGYGIATFTPTHVIFTLIQPVVTSIALQVFFFVA